jgi:predicted RNA-binding protein with PIN domain
MSSPKPYLLVDGHSMIFHREDLLHLHTKNTRAARQRLLDELSHLHDTGNWLVTLVFDGKQGTQDPVIPGTMVVIYSTADQTADSIIERLVASVTDRSRVHVVTADQEEAQTVESLGAVAHGPLWLQSLQSATEADYQQTLSQVRRRAKW